MNLVMCDVCKEHIKTKVISVTPGYVGSKDLCDICWKRWGDVVMHFFGVA